MGVAILVVCVASVALLAFKLEAISNRLETIVSISVNNFTMVEKFTGKYYRRREKPIDKKEGMC